MPEVILQVYPSLGAEAEMLAKRPIGRNNDAYQDMLQGMIELCQAADELGYWGITHVEHHLHSEGMEISPVPKPGEHLAGRLVNSGLLIAGTVDDVKRQMETLLVELPIDYLGWLFHWGMIPKAEGLRTIELFANEVCPEFGIKSHLDGV